MNTISFHLILTLFLSVIFINLDAREPYHTTITVGTQKETVSAPNLVDLKRELSTISIQKDFPTYTPDTPVELKYNIRGIKALASFAANSSTLVVSIPQAGTTQTFSGATRDESLTLFKNFIQEGGRHHKLLKAYARYSPIDPIAGNPNSLQNQMAQADYLIGRLSPLAGCDSCWTAQPIVNLYQGGLDVGRAFSKEFDTTAVSFPIRYSFSPHLNCAFILDVPLTYLRNGGASSLVGSLGIGFRVPLLAHWSLTPLVRFGFGGTLDLCTSGCFFSTGVTSCLDYKIDNFVLSMTNYAGYFTSTNLWLSGINFNYHLHNYIFKNGLSIATCKGLVLCNRSYNVRFSFEDSYFAKDRLFINHYDEVSVAIMTDHVIPYFIYDCLSLGFSYQFGQKQYRGYVGHLTYQF